jgi:hypothetical protein
MTVDTHSFGPLGVKTSARGKVRLSGPVGPVGLAPALSSDRRNISAMIRATGSGEARCGVDERIMGDV